MQYNSVESPVLGEVLVDRFQNRDSDSRYSFLERDSCIAMMRTNCRRNYSFELNAAVPDPIKVIDWVLPPHWHLHYDDYSYYLKPQLYERLEVGDFVVGYCQRNRRAYGL